MTIQEAIELFKRHQGATLRRSTIRSYGKFLECFEKRFAEREVVSLTADYIGKFLEECSESLNKSTRHLRYAMNCIRFILRQLCPADLLFYFC